MTYVDGFVAAVPTTNREIYKKHAEAAAVVFKEHGALKLVEQGPQARQHALTCVSWRHATGCAVEQADSETLLELADCVAERARG